MLLSKAAQPLSRTAGRIAPAASWNRGDGSVALVVMPELMLLF